MNDTKDYHVNIKTEQAGAFRILIEALKEILTEGNLIFDSTGISPKEAGIGWNLYVFFDS